MDEELEAFPDDSAALEVDVSLSPLEALALYGRSAVLEQCLAYIGSAGAAAASSSSDDILHIVLPLLHEALGDEDPLVCTAALRQLPAVGSAWLGKDDRSGVAAWEDVCQYIAVLLASCDEQVSDTAIKAFAAVVQLLPEARQVHMAASAIRNLHARASEGEQRAAAARAVAGIAALLPPRTSAARSLLSTLLDMQRDSNVFVREVIGRQLGVAAPAATDPAGAAALLHALRALAADRVWNVRRAAAEALPGVARAGMPDGVETAVELLGSLMEDASSWVRAAALLAGGVVFSQAPAGSLSAGLLTPYLDAACALESPLSRGALPISCASSFASIAAAAGPPSWPMLRDAFVRLAQHGEPSVRSAAAASLPHAAATISRWPGGPQFLAERFEAFCADEDASVQEAALADILLLASTPSAAQQSTLLAAAADAVQRQPSQCVHRWRGRLAFAEQADGLAAICAPQDLSAYVLPAVLRLCSDPVASVRHAAASQLGVVLRQSAVLEPEDHHSPGEATIGVAAQLRSLAQGPNFQQRVSYAHAFQSMAQHLPAKVITSLLLPSFLALVSDPVVDVRLMAAATLLCLAKRSAHHDCMEHPSKPEPDADEAPTPRPIITAVLNDSRSREVMHDMTTDSNLEVARMAVACAQCTRDSHCR